MAEIVWTEPALGDLDAIADYIAIEDRAAAQHFVLHVFQYVGRLADHPRLGPKPPELVDSRYRQIVEPPCRIFYREDGERIFVLHVMRGERLLRPEILAARTSSS